jgi:hypothetical protein
VDVTALYDRAAELVPDQMAAVAARGDDGSYRYVDMSISTQAGDAAVEQLATDLAADLEPVTNIEGTTAVAPLADHHAAGGRGPSGSELPH